MAIADFGLRIAFELLYPKSAIRNRTQQLQLEPHVLSSFW